MRSIVYLFFILSTSLFCFSQTKENIIVKINPNHKNDVLLSDLDLKPAIILPNLNKKVYNDLQANNQAAALLEELRSYYTVEVSAQKLNSTINNLRKNKNFQTVFQSSYFKIDEENRLLQDNVATNEPLFRQQWAIHTINAQSAWKIATGKNVVVAVIDTGIDYNNDEFINQLWVNAGEDLNKNGKFDNWSYKEERNGIYGDLNGIDDDGNGYVDDVIGYDFVDRIVVTVGDVMQPDSDPYDEHGHGTEVASVIAAKHNNNFGITGIAYNAKIMGLRTHDATGVSECKDIANAIVYAVLNGAKIINLSSGESSDSPLMHTAIKFAYAMNCVIIASAGNKGTTLPHYPSDYAEVISVGGCNKDLKRIFNFGDRITISAPADSIYVATRNNAFKYSRGTSFSAPIVAAVAALILEKDNTLSPSEVKGILQTTTKQTTIGWTTEFGAGIVNAYNAVSNIAKTHIEITTPQHNDFINISKIDTISVQGSTATPLFDSYLIRIRKGNENINPNQNYTWDTVITANNKSVLNGNLGSFRIGKYINELKDSIRVYTMSLLVNLKNGNTFEERIHLFLCSDSNGIEINKLAVYNPFYYEKRVPLFNIKTNIPTSVTVCYREKGSNEQYSIALSNEYITNNHSFVVDEIPIDTEIEGYVTAYIPNSSAIPAIKQDFTFKRQSDYFNNNSFDKKSYSLAPSYLYSKPFLDKNGKQQICASALDNSMNVGKIKMFEISVNKQDTNFIEIDSSSNNGAAQGFGDSNGDGIKEIISNYYGISNLYQSSKNNSSNFSNTLFTTPQDNTMFCQGMCDFDGDGKEELVFVVDSVSLLIYSFKNNNYQLMLRTDINELMRNIDTVKYKLRVGFAMGDFDGDGKNEIALTTSQNNYLLIIDINNYKATVKDWVKLENYFYEPYTHLITAGDLDGDGRMDIIYLHYGKINNRDGELGKTEMWTYQVFKCDEENKIKKVFEDDIYGVRITYAVGYKVYTHYNGITTGNIDNEKGDEVVICAFPNIYTLKWDQATNSLLPMWTYTGSISNTAVIGDFDGNGKTEIGFATRNNTLFYEFNDKSKINYDIGYFNGWANSSSSLHFCWKKNNLIVEYELYLIETQKLKNKDTIFEKYKTTENYIDIQNLKPNTEYTAYIKAANLDGQPSNLINVFTNQLTKPLSITILNNKVISVKFSQHLALTIEQGKFKLIDDNKEIYPVANISAVSNSSVALEFPIPLLNKKYKLAIPSIIDGYGNPTIADTLEFTVNLNSVLEVFLKSLEFVPSHKILLQFSEPVVAATVSDINNYKLYPYGAIESVTVLKDDLVEINLSSAIKLEGRGKNYLITAGGNIQAVSGNQMTKGAGNTLGFTFAENDISSVYIYPNPIKKSLHNEAYIGHLTRQSTVEILTVEGTLIRSLEEFDGNGGIEWDLRDSNGNKLDIGIYIIRAIDKSNASGKEVLTKFAITQ